MAAKNFLVNVGLNDNQLLDAVIENRTEDPTGPQGKLYYNSNDEVLRLKLASNWATVASQSYVDAAIQGLDTKQSVRAATVDPIADLASPPASVDGVTLADGDRVLVKAQAAASENGIYVYDSVTGLTRADDAAQDGQLTSGSFTFVEEGSVNSDAGFVLVSDGDITIGTSNMTWTQFSGAGQIDAGTGLSKTGNVLNVNGTTDRVIVDSDSVDIAPTYAGQASITTLGTISTGTWEGDVIDVQYGGLGNDTFTANSLLYYDGTSIVSAPELDFSQIPSKFATDIGNGSDTTLAVTHNLDSTDVVVSVYEKATNEEVLAEVSVTSVNEVSVSFSAAPSTAEYRVVVVG